MESKNMNYLISSIKKETSKLKRNLTENIKSRVQDSAGKEKLSPKISPSNKDLPPLPKLTNFTPQETIRADITTSKILIENLIQDNKMLHEDIEDFKITLEVLVEKLKDTKRELEVEKLNNTRIDILEQQILKEQARKQGLLQQHLKLKEKYLSLLNTMREAAFSLSDDNREDITLFEKLNKENSKLKELLAFSRISDPKTQDLERISEENKEDDHEKYKNTLKNYRDQRIAQKRSKSFALVGRKNYLLMSPKEKNNSNNVWDNFFKKHEQKAKN
ncbi:hypothetical protein SteCoe_8911 [Stentor coeruleus]|uniref:Uncharacterized protein n=1 Tax=Stentor coeruleus TaxID=5963 RepID=A0A1R2CJ69_9CILI|nr:hypothetical protein SteCoe_8911 [Stentor coeruleus]